LSKNEQEDKKEEEKRLSQEITVLWKDHVDQNLSELHLKNFIQRFKGRLFV
jgi:hypothetical protein